MKERAWYKKLATWLVLLAVLVAMTFSSLACSKKKKNDPKDPSGIIDVGERDPGNLVMESTLSLIVGDTRLLSVSGYEEEAGKTLTFTSSAPNVASVNESGVVTAARPGTATVTAAYGDKTATCAVTVGMGSFIPSLSFANGTPTQLAFATGDDYTFSPQISFNGKTFTPDSVTFTPADPTVLGFTDNKLTALKKGDTSVTATAVWCGFSANDYETLRVSFDVNVKKALSFRANGSALTDVTLYTVSGVSGYEGAYETEMNFVPTATIDSQDVSVTVNVEDTDVVRYDGTEHKLIMVGYGTTTLTLSCVDPEEPGATLSSPAITVTVLRPEIVIDTTVENFSAKKGGIYEKNGSDYTTTSLTSLIVNGSSHTFTEATQIVRDTPQPGVTVSNGLVSGLFTERNEMTQTQITLGNDDVLFTFTDVQAYTDILAAADDVKQFDRKAEYAAGRTAKLEGYFVVVEDIDMGGYDFNTNTANLSDRGIQWNSITHANTTNYFQGTFDGRGHRIYNWTNTASSYATAGGFFGAIYDGSVIENAAFECTSTATGKVLAATMGTVTVRNVYIHVGNDITATQMLGVLGTNPAGGRFENILIEANILNATVQYYSGALLSADGGAWLTSTTYENIYFIDAGDKKIPLVAREGNHHARAANEGETTWGGDTRGTVTLDGVRRYKNAASAVTDEDSDFSAFNSEYWHTENGMLVWGKGTSTFAVVLEGKTMASGDGFEAEEGESYGVRVRGLTDQTYTLSATGNIEISQDGRSFALGTGTGGGSVTVDYGGTSLTFTVTKARETVTLNDPIRYFSAKKGGYYQGGTGDLQSVLSHYGSTITGDVTKVSQVLQDEKVQLSVDSGMLTGIRTSSTDVTNVVLEVETAETVYRIENIEAYTDVLFTADDLKQFDRKAEYLAGRTAPLVGYFILQNDVDMNDYGFNTSCSHVSECGMSVWNVSTNYFQGTFDGQGHRIHNWKDTNGVNGAYGFFGAIQNGSTIKNVAFECASTQGHALATAVGNDVTLENVSITMRNVTANLLGAIGIDVGDRLTLRNVFLQVDHTVSYTQTAARGLLTGGATGHWKTTLSAQNVYVIGDYPVVMGNDAHGIGYAENETADTWAYTNTKTQLTGVRSYKSVQAMTADGDADFASFDSDYWHIANGVLTFGNGTNTPAVVTAGGIVADGGTVKVKQNVATQVYLRSEAFSQDGISLASTGGVTVSGASFTLTGASGTVTVTYGSGTQLTFNVEIAKEQVVVTADSDFSVYDGKVVSTQEATWFGAANYTITSASLNGVPLTVTGGKIGGISCGYTRQAGTSFNGTSVNNIAPTKPNKLTGDLVVETDTVAVTFKSVYAYDAVITSGQQMATLFSVDTAGEVIDGYYILGSDIDMTGVTFDHSGLTGTKPWTSYTNTTTDIPGFRGIFDGNGHTITNYTTGFGGIFGQFYYSMSYTWANTGHGSDYCQTAVVRNVAFANVDASAGPVLARGVQSYQSHSGNLSYLTMLENIYVQYASSCTALGGLITHFTPAVGMVDLIVDASQVPTSVVNNGTQGNKDDESKLLGNGTLFGSVGYIQVVNQNYKTVLQDGKYMQNVHVICHDGLSLGNSGGTDNTYAYPVITLYAANKECDDANKLQVATVYQFATAGEMKADANFDATAFTGGFWDVYLA